MRDLRVIWRSDPIINGPLTVRSALPDAFKEDMRLFHLALPKAHPAIYHRSSAAPAPATSAVTERSSSS